MVKSESHIPKIRFQGFSDAWYAKKLSDISNSISSGKDKPLETGDYLVYGSTGIIGKTNLASYIGEYILIARVGANAGFLTKTNGEFGVTDNTLVVNLKNKKITDFLFYLLENFGLNRLIFGSGQPLITGGQLKELLFHFPNIQEQTKIGNFFQKIDQVIELQQKALDTARNYKKSMLQKMFPQKGEKVPQIRFDGFSGDWNLKKIGDISKSFSGGTPSVDNRDFYNNGTIPFIRSGEISKNKTELFITELALEKSSSKIVKKGDILYALYGATSGEVARSQIDGAINQAILTIIPKDKYDSEYLVQVLALSKNLILSKFLQGGQGNLSGAIIKDLKVMFPKFEEQKKIGEFFQKLDQQIEQHEKKLESYQNLKKAMLQRMFV